MVRFRFVLRGAEQIGTSLSVKRFAVLLLKYGLLMLALLVTAVLSAVTTMRVVLTSQEVVAKVDQAKQRSSPVGTGACAA